MKDKHLLKGTVRWTEHLSQFVYHFQCHNFMRFESRLKTNRIYTGIAAQWLLFYGKYRKDHIAGEESKGDTSI